MQTPRKTTLFRTLAWTSAGLAALSLVACGGSGSSTGTLQLAMTDAPACGYQHVYVTVTKIRVHQSATAQSTDAGWSELSITPQRIDLLSLTNGVLQELGSLPLPTGTYQQVRLVLADNPSSPSPSNPLANALVLTTDPTTEIALSTPSAQQSGFKLQAHFDVLSGQVADMVLDFDACRSIVKSGNSGNYNIKPVVAVMKRLTTAIEGYVHPSIAASVQVSTRDPDNNLRVTVPNPTTGWFKLAYLPESTNYTVVVAGQNVTTAAVTSVPVSVATGVTVLNTALTAIQPAASTMASVSGVVTNSSSVLLTDAYVSARQTLSTGQVLDVAGTGVNATTANYSLSLPLAAAVKAPYASGGALTFTTDSMVAGRYNVTGTATGYTTQSTNPVVDLGIANSNTVKDLVLTP
ncbi:MAG: DUF4382 domain-containing protein [Limnohabitans sp.]